MAAVALPLALAGTAIEGFSQFQQAQYQAAVAKNNSKIALANADRANEAAQIEQLRSDREYRAQEGAVVASQAASGLDVLGHSQTLTRQNLARVRGEQAEDIRLKGLNEVRNFQQDSANFLGEARAQKTAAWMSLASTAFSLAATTAKSPQGRKTFNSLIGGAKSFLGG